ncbi:hypothetical protein HH297_05755 [Xanthomonas sp. Kuri4-3]
MPLIDSYELERVAMVNALDVLDPDLGASLDPITRLAAFTFGVPVVMVTIVDADSQRFISKVGTELTRTDRRSRSAPMRSRPATRSWRCRT